VKLAKDLREFVGLMNSHGVDYVLVGGHAVAYHGYPRFTGDIDLFVRVSERNIDKIAEVLDEFGFPVPAPMRSRLLEPGKVLQLGRPPNRIDLLTSIEAVGFEEAWKDSEVVDVDGLRIRVLGLDSLLKNKQAVARPKDLVDVDELRRLGKPRDRST
jgi:predicted nucleotidyltransferase